MPRGRKPKAVKEEIARIQLKAVEDKTVEAGLQKTFGEASSTSPVVTTMGIQRIGEFYAFVIYEIQGDRVLSVKAEEPNAKAIAVDLFKIQAQKTFLD